MTGNERMAPLVVTSTSLVAIIWVLMVLGIRVYLRLKLNGPVSNDDYAAILATVLGVAQSSLVLVGVQLGLGENIDHQDEVDRQSIMKVRLSIHPRLDTLWLIDYQFGYMSALLYLSATYVSRASSCLLYIRLTSTRSHLFAAFGGLLLSAFGGVACVLTVAFQCKVPKPWDGQDCVEVVSGSLCSNSSALNLTACSGRCGALSRSRPLRWKYSYSASHCSWSGHSE